MLAALANGLSGHLDFAVPENGSLRIAFEKGTAIESERFLAILLRQTTRCNFDATQLSTAELAQLERAGTGRGILVLITFAGENSRVRCFRQHVSNRGFFFHF